jgi:hypothetical protein
MSSKDLKDHLSDGQLLGRFMTRLLILRQCGILFYHLTPQLLRVKHIHKKGYVPSRLAALCDLHIFICCVAKLKWFVSLDHLLSISNHCGDQVVQSWWCAAHGTIYWNSTNYVQSLVSTTIMSMCLCWLLVFLNVTTKSGDGIHPRQRRQKCLLAFLSTITKYEGFKSIPSNGTRNASWYFLAPSLRLSKP